MDLVSPPMSQQSTTRNKSYTMAAQNNANYKNENPYKTNKNINNINNNTKVNSNNSKLR
jgi:hypothetical protein